MHCQECHERPATLHFTKIVNGQKTEMHLCEECARDKGEHIPGSNSYSIHDLLSGLLNFDQPVNGSPSSSRTTQVKPLVCEHCGLSYDKFARTGRFGCSGCYETFDKKLDPIFKRVHSGNHRHAGKVPKRTGGKMQIQREIDQHRETLRQLIEQEEFEQAAEVRDQIRSLELKMREGKGNE